jgi:hypothetical protein
MWIDIISSLSCLDPQCRTRLVLECSRFLSTKNKLYQTVWTNPIISKLTKLLETHIVADIDWISTRIAFLLHLIDPVNRTISTILKR